MDVDTATLTDLRNELVKRGLSASTPGLSGADRRDALVERLREVIGPNHGPASHSASKDGGGSARESALAGLTMNELRSKCEVRYWF